MGSALYQVDVIILTYNESAHLERAVSSVRSFCRNVFVIDSFSTDRTVEIAQSLGAIVLQNHWVNYATQFQWALDNAPITADWILRLDADEIIEPDLAARIVKRLPQLPGSVTGINFKRKHIFLGRFVRFGGRYPLVLLRLWRRGGARIEQRWMDEHIVLTHGRSITLNGGFADWNLGDLSFFVDKHNKYATREAVDVLNAKYGLFKSDAALSQESGSLQATIKRFIKEGVYNRLPFWLGPLAYFLYRYFIQLGFLDAREGLIYHFLQGFWYRFLVGAKVLELDRALKPLPSREERIAALGRLTGLKLTASPPPPAGQTPQ